jgi:hypothetical protein
MRNLLLLFLSTVIAASSIAQTQSKRALLNQKQKSIAVKEQIRQKLEKRPEVPEQKVMLKGVSLNRTVKIADKSTDFNRLRGIVKSNLAGTSPAATIIVSVADPGSQKEGSMGGSTQILIADSSAVDGSNKASMDAMWNLFADGGQPLADFYNDLVAKIPDNAAPTLIYSQGLVNETRSISIPLSDEQNTFDVIFAGIDSVYYYNPAYGFSNPAPEALEDNLLCEDKWIYFFDYSYWTYLDLTKIPPFEIEAIALETTPSSAELTAAEPITFTIRNTGNQPLTTFDFYVKINDDEEIRETFTTPADSTLDIGEFLTYTFSAKADFSLAGEYTIEARAEIAGEFDNSNNTLTIKREHTTVGTLPFFDPMDEDLSNWAIIDRNGTDEDGGGTWMSWPPYYTVENYQALYMLATDRPGDDWLRTIRPYHLEAGKYSVSFLQQAMMEIFPEVLNVYYGTSSDVASMTQLANFTVTNELLLKNIVNFNNPTPGDYYFAFQAASEADMFGIIIDDVTIAAGTVTPQPDLYLYQSFFKSYPSCELSDSAAVVVYNLGDISADIASFDLKYAVNGGTEHTKTVNKPLAAGSRTTVFLDKLDMETVGEHTLIVVGVLDNQITNNNDTISVSIEKTVPVAVLPYTSNFSNEDDAKDWVLLTEGDWDLEDGYYTPIYADPLISKCIELQPGDYTLSHTFKAGAYLELFDMYFYGQYTIRMGEPGTDPSKWTYVIGFEENLYVPNDTTVACEFSIEQAGSYTFAFTASSFSLKEVTISAGLGVPNVLPDESTISLTPNPASDWVKIESKGAGIDQVTISDISGRVIYDAKQSSGKNDCLVNVSNFSKGLYLVKIRKVNSENSYVKKMIVR